MKTSAQSKSGEPCRDLPHHFSRREFMHVGLIGGLGLSLPEFLRIKAHGAQKFYESKEGVAKSVIHIYLPGGMAHQESWDPKPHQPFGSTKVPTDLKSMESWMARPVDP